MRTILLADDSPKLAEHCWRELEDEGYRVVTARDSREAVAVFQRELPDVVILGLHSPRAGDSDAVEQIRRTHPEAPIIFFVSDDETGLLDDCRRFPLEAVEKSADLTELKRAIVRSLMAIRNSPLRRPNMAAAANA